MAIPHSVSSNFLGTLICVFLLCSAVKAEPPRPLTLTQESTRPWEDEIFYQIFPRSFYDSNGDRVGDIQGIIAKLDYLQDLGVTGIWTTPVMKARCYHNYYIDSFDSLDPAFGTWNDWYSLVGEVHRRGMKIFVDMEPQYVADHHPWYVDAHNNPASKFTSYLWFEDSLNNKTVDRRLGTFDSSTVTIIGVRMNSPEVRDVVANMFLHFADPMANGSLENGVDGFRIDHLMDDLDNQKKNVNLYSEFWNPIFSKVRAINPNIFILGEQADWGFGKDALTRGGCDGVFAFPQWWGTTTFNKERLSGLIDTTWLNTPPGKQQFTFIENHDIDRFASKVNGDQAKLRIGATLNILLKGVPCLYYGQELGVRGKKGEWHNDGNDIPLREAFPWTSSINSKGMATWYQGKGPWWQHSSLKAQDVPALEEQKHDSGSLWNFYRGLIKLRTSSSALKTGSYEKVHTLNDSIFAFRRFSPESNETGSAFVIVMNFSSVVQTAVLSIGLGESFDQVDVGSGSSRNVEPIVVHGSDFTVTLPPYGVKIFSRR